MHQLNIRAIVDRLSAKLLIRVQSGAFAGRFGDQKYEIGSTEAGVARAIRRMSELRRECAINDNLAAFKTQTCRPAVRKSLWPPATCGIVDGRATSTC